MGQVKKPIIAPGDIGYVPPSVEQAEVPDEAKKGGEETATRWSSPSTVSQATPEQTPETLDPNIERVEPTAKVAIAAVTKWDKFNRNQSLYAQRKDNEFVLQVRGVWVKGEPGDYVVFDPISENFAMVPKDQWEDHFTKVEEEPPAMAAFDKEPAHDDNQLTIEEATNEQWSTEKHESTS